MGKGVDRDTSMHRQRDLEKLGWGRYWGYWQSMQEERKAETRALTARDRSPGGGWNRGGGHLQR